MTDWCILRTAGSSTLRLAASLTEAGFEAWTPVEIVKRWAGRPRKLVKQEKPAFSGYVFARTDRLLDLIELSHVHDLPHRSWSAARSQHLLVGRPDFQFLRHAGRLSMVPNAGLELLRREDRIERARESAPRFSVGDNVRAVDGPCEGLTGTVEAARGGEFVMVLFHDTPMAWMIATWQLALVHVSNTQPEQGIAA